MKLAVIGGNGYVGRALIKRLLKETTHEIISLSPHAESNTIIDARLSAKNVDIFNETEMHDALQNCHSVYYLVHMMGQTKMDFELAETKAAESLVAAVKNTEVKQIIYLGGLGDDTDPKLSKHLASRHHTGVVLRQSDAQVVEFRASMVIGHGSVSYDIIANLVHRLPILFLPTWARTLTQPIGLNDALAYLVAALKIPSDKDEIIEIGGPESMTYETLMRRYAHWKKTKTLYVHVPFVPIVVASWWLDTFTPGAHAKVGRTMVESLANPMIVTSFRAAELFPDIKPIPAENSFV